MNVKKLVKVGLLTVSLTVAMSAAAFAATDTAGHWAEDVANKWERMGLLYGYPDGTARLDQEVNRAEIGAMIKRIGHYPNASVAPTFGDVAPSDWFYGDVATMVEQGIMSGYDATTFGAGDPVTREQMGVMEAKIKNLPPNEARAYEFNDGEVISVWARGSVGAVAEAGYMIGDTNNNFNGLKALTRGEAISTLDRLFAIEEAPQGGEPTEPTEPTTPAAEGEVKVSLASENGSIAVNQVKTVNYDLTGDATVTAASSDEAIATVEVKDGKIQITGVKKGSATITVTATAEDGTTATDTYDVTVTSGISISGGGGGGGSASQYEGVIPEGNITPDGELNNSDITSGNISTDFSDGKVSVTNKTGKKIKSIKAVLPAGSQVTVSGLAGGPFTFETTKDLVRETDLSEVQALTVDELMGAVDPDSEAYAKLSKAKVKFTGSYELIKGAIESTTEDGAEVTSATVVPADGLTVDNAEALIKTLKLTLTA